MGENVMQGQVKQFQKGRDRALNDMAAPSLFDRPDIVTTTYTASTINGVELQVGHTLVGHISGDGSRINLADGHRVVGVIEGDGASALISALKEPNSPGIANMLIVNVSAISGFIKTTVSEPKDSDD